MVDNNRDDPKLAPNVAEEPTSQRATELTYAIEYRGNSIDLKGGQLLAGRSAMCRLVLDDPLVSRQHAEFRLEGGVVFLHDLKSVNGIFVNGQKVDRQVRLAAGDRITIGSQDLYLRTRAIGNSTADRVDRRRFAETLHDQPAVTDVGMYDDDDGGNAAEDSTIQGDGLDLLATVADKVLALRRGDDAERILTTYLLALLERTRLGQACPAHTAEKAVTYASKLAAVTGKASWVDYCIQLYDVLQRPLPGPVVDSLYDLLRKITGTNLGALRAYVATLRAAQSQLGPAEKFLVQRIEGLERLAALR